MQRTIEINWNGEALEVETNMKNAFRIESKLKTAGTNLMKMSSDLQSLALAYTDGVMLVAEVMRCGGEKVTDEDVYSALFGDGEIEEESFFEMVGDILFAFMPKPKKKPVPRK